MQSYGFDGLRRLSIARIAKDDKVRSPPGEDFLFMLQFDKDDDAGEEAVIDFYLEMEKATELMRMLQELLRSSGPPKLELVIKNSN